MSIEFYLVGVVLAYALTKYFRNKAEKEDDDLGANDWGSVIITMIMSAFSWLWVIIILIIIILAIIVVQLQKSTYLKKPPKWL